MVERSMDDDKVLLIKFEVIVSDNNSTHAEFRVNKKDFEQISGFLPREIVILKLVQKIFKVSRVDLDSIEIVEIKKNN